ncbi:MAG: phenylacetate--CoA ligase family protein [Deltaproteobacteria bacterium]|nr:phenylacetate--CoA ligase family protein [Deltaproteobacteria bacterium]
MRYHELIFFAVHRLLGTGTAQAWRTLLAAEDQSPGTLFRSRDAALAAVWERLRTATPFYREWLPPGPLLDGSGRLRPDVWAAAPVTDRRDIRTHFDDMVAFPSADARRAWRERRALPAGWTVQKSGGSTGQPVEYLQDRTWQAWNRAAALWCDKLSGAWPCREKRLKIWGGTQEIRGVKVPLTTRLSSWLQRGIILPSFRMDEATMRGHIETINRRTDAPTLEGYVSTLYTLARFARGAGLSVRPLQRVISSAGTLHAPMKELMEAVYGGPVFDRYGSRDGGATANQCELRRGLHVCEPTLYVEVVDKKGRQVPDGSEGDILLTQLHNHGMPLFRYRIGDRGVMDPEPCPCGRPHRVLKKLLGRVTERICTPDGRILDSLYFVHLLGVVLNSGWLDRFQVVQDKQDEVRIALVPREGSSPGERESGLRAVIAELEESLGPSVRLDARLVGDIPPSPSGKHLYVVSSL